ncbi:MAG: LysR family transcriptional regulator [Woeseiaceae bacterium]|nr:LysR family transcriptional regulator [Woeseiaceae bacterium]
MDRFEDLQAFVAVVEAGSFTAAADRLDLAKSAVSRRVAALEERLGAQLIRRTTRSLSLTETGQGFYERSARILADLEEAESAVAQLHGELRGVLRVALPLSFGVRHMCRPIAEFSRRHPRVTFDLNLNDRRIDLIEEGVDLAVRIGRLADSSLIARRLFEARTVVVASKDYLAARGRPETPEDLARHACLVYANLPEPDKWVCRDADGKTHRVEITPTMIATSGDFLSAAAVRGLGLAMQPTFIAGEAISRGDLVPVLTNYRWPVTPAYAVYPPTRHLSYRVREFIDYLAEYFSGTPYWDEDCPDCD